MASLVEVDETEKSSPHRCSYTVSGQSMLLQAVYVCTTCGLDEERGHSCLCEGCVATCHAGHATSFLGYGRAYCDCGAAGCVLAARSAEEADVTAEGRPRRAPLAQDADGRLAGTLESGLSVPSFTACHVSALLGVGLGSVLGHADDAGDEQTCETLAALAAALAARTKDTFWVAAADGAADRGHDPPCALERLAAAVFAAHTAGAAFDPSTAGAEWWVQVKRTEDSDNDNDNNKSSFDSAYGVGGVDLHYDKDEALAEGYGIGVFPQVSTVTYIAAPPRAAPTAVLETTAATPVGGPIRCCFLSRPVRGKHVAFDGRYLHGAPALLAPPPAGLRASGGAPQIRTRLEEMRVTFLVNVWLGHQPAGVGSLPGDVRAALRQVESDLAVGAVTRSSSDGESSSSSSRSSTLYSGVKAVKVAAKHVEAEDGQGDWVDVPFVSAAAQWGKGADERGLFLRMWLPHEDFLVRGEAVLVGAGCGEGTAGKAKGVRINSGAKKKTAVAAAPPAPDKEYSTFAIAYSTEAAACLMYEGEDEEDEEEEEVDEIQEEGAVR